MSHVPSPLPFSNSIEEDAKTCIARHSFILIFCGFTEQVQVMFALCRCGGGQTMRENISWIGEIATVVYLSNKPESNKNISAFVMTFNLKALFQYNGKHNSLTFAFRLYQL